MTRSRRPRSVRTATESAVGSKTPSPRFDTISAGPVGRNVFGPTTRTGAMRATTGATTSWSWGSAPKGSIEYRPSRRRRTSPPPGPTLLIPGRGRSRRWAAASPHPRDTPSIGTSGRSGVTVAHSNSSVHTSWVERSRRARARRRALRSVGRRCPWSTVRSRGAARARRRVRRPARRSVHIGPVIGIGIRPPRRTACHTLAAPGPTMLSGPSTSSEQRRDHRTGRVVGVQQLKHRVGQRGNRHRRQVAALDRAGSACANPRSSPSASAATGMSWRRPMSAANASNASRAPPERRRRRDRRVLVRYAGPTTTAAVHRDRAAQHDALQVAAHALRHRARRRHTSACTARRPSPGVGSRARRSPK